MSDTEDTAGAVVPVALIPNAQRMLVDASTALLDLADQVGKGERIGADGETVMLMAKISGAIGDAVGLLFDIEDGALADGPLGRRGPLQ